MPKEINFKNIESLHGELEKNSVKYLRPHKISEMFKRVRDLKYEKGDKEEDDILQWEVDFFNFDFKDGKLSPLFQMPNDKGELVEYPTISRFCEGTYKYLDKRLSKTSNPLLRARYAHILWCSPKKKPVHAKITVDSYLTLVNVYEEKDKQNPKDHYGFDIFKVITNAYIVSHQISYKLSAVHSEIVRLVNEFNKKSSSSFRLKCDLIEFMLARDKVFSVKDFGGIGDVCWQMHKSLLIKGNIQFAISILGLGNRVESRVGTKKYEWIECIANYYESMMAESEKEGNPVSVVFCENAIENYKKIGNDEKVKELENKYSKLKESIKLKEFVWEEDITDYVNECKVRANEIVQDHTSEEIIRFLMCGKDIIPKYKDVGRFSRKIMEEHPLHRLFPVSIFDQNSNKPQVFSEGDELEYFSVLKQYHLFLNIGYIHRINQLLFIAIKEKKLSSDIIINFLKSNSWVGRNISKKRYGKTISYNWLSVLAPSINEYFSQIEYSECSKNPPNLILCTDSLTLKIEGLLRDICRYSGIDTFYVKADNEKRMITLEKDIQRLLHEKGLEDIFDEDELFFFRFLLVEKAGYNLRHMVAHSLMIPEEYSIYYMNLLLLAMLRLAKYTLEEK